MDWTLQRNVLKVKDAAEAIVAKTSTTSNTVNYLALIILVARYDLIHMIIKSVKKDYNNIDLSTVHFKFDVLILSDIVLQDLQLGEFCCPAAKGQTDKVCCNVNPNPPVTDATTSDRGRAMSITATAFTSSVISMGFFFMLI